MINVRPQCYNYSNKFKIRQGVELLKQGEKPIKVAENVHDGLGLDYARSDLMFCTGSGINSHGFGKAREKDISMRLKVSWKKLKQCIFKYSGFDRIFCAAPLSYRANTRSRGRGPSSGS